MVKIVKSSDKDSLMPKMPSAAKRFGKALTGGLGIQEK